MSDNLSYRPLPAIARAGSGLASLVPARSQTDPVEPTQPQETAPDSHKRVHSNTLSGHPSHNGSHRHHHHHHSHRHRAKEAVQSAIDLKPPISFDHILRRDRKSPGSSRTGSSGPQQRDEEARRVQQQQRRQQQQAQDGAARQSVQRADVEKIEAENAKREEELRQALSQAEELGMRSTRELDDTYYAILEKASILRSIVVGLQQLAEESKRMHELFLKDSMALLQETTKNIDGFGEFREQEQSIEALVKRLDGSRREADRLNERLEQARQRVEEFEKRRKERLATRRKQWNATWGTTLGVVILVLALLLLRSPQRGAEKWNDVRKSLLQAEEMAASVVSLAPSKLWPAPSPSEDPYLQKLFDTL